MQWYEIKNKADRAEIWIYEQIGEDWWSGEGVTAKNFQKDLAEIKASQIDLHINSPGGEVFDGIAIYNLLKQHPANITTYIDGLAASIASVVALSGDSIYMAENALFMIHNPQGMVVGQAEDMRKTADLLDTVRGSIAKAYIAKTGKDENEVNALMDAETWLTADEAFEFGFIDNITGKMDMAACVQFAPIMAKAGFKRIPDFTSQMKNGPTAKDAEKALRDVGFTRKQAKTVLAKGIVDGLRDADSQDASVVQDNSLRDVVEVIPSNKKDRVAELLVQLERIAPRKTN